VAAFVDLVVVHQPWEQPKLFSEEVRAGFRTTAVEQMIVLDAFTFDLNKTTDSFGA